MYNVYMGSDVEDFIFGEGTTYEDNFDNVSEEEMNEFGIIECTEDPDVACYRIALENEQNYNAIMTAMMNKEYQVLESTGREMVYEAFNISDFLDTLKRQVQKFWAKIKGVFKKVMDKINSIVLSNKAFVKKYRGVANSLKKPVEKGFTGYNFTEKGLRIDYSTAVLKALDGAAKESALVMAGDEAITGIMNELRGNLCDKSSVSAADFDKALRVKLYGGENSITISSNDSNFSSLLNRLENAAESKKAAKAAHKEAEKTVKGMLSEINKQKADSDDPDEVKVLKTFSRCLTSAMNVMSAALSAQTKAIVAMAAQDRRMANYWISANNKKKGTQESAGFGDGLNVELI